MDSAMPNRTRDDDQDVQAAQSTRRNADKTLPSDPPTTNPPTINPPTPDPTIELRAADLVTRGADAESDDAGATQVIKRRDVSGPSGAHAHSSADTTNDFEIPAELIEPIDPSDLPGSNGVSVFDPFQSSRSSQPSASRVGGGVGNVGGVVGKKARAQDHQDAVGADALDAESGS
jgi:hypothetical protein